MFSAAVPLNALNITVHVTKIPEQDYAASLFPPDQTNFMALLFLFCFLSLKYMSQRNISVHKSICKL